MPKATELSIGVGIRQQRKESLGCRARYAASDSRVLVNMQVVPKMGQIIVEGVNFKVGVDARNSPCTRGCRQQNMKRSTAAVPAQGQ